MRRRFEAPPNPHPTGGYDTVLIQRGQIEYRRGGVLHREDGPALIAADGAEGWYVDGVESAPDR